MISLRLSFPEPRFSVLGSEYWTGFYPVLWCLLRQEQERQGSGLGGPVSSVELLHILQRSCSKDCGFICLSQDFFGGKKDRRRDIPCPWVDWLEVKRKDGCEYCRFLLPTLLRSLRWADGQWSVPVAFSPVIIKMSLAAWPRQLRQWRYLLSCL